MKLFRHPLAPLVAATLLLLATTGLLLTQSLAHTNGTVVYGLDDAYIHMAMADSLADTGVMGVNKGEYAAASSSPLWTLLLAVAFAVSGSLDSIPLLINLLLSVAVLIIVYWYGRRFELGISAQWLSLLWIVVATPLWPLVFGGMEHVLQLAVDLLFCVVAAESISSRDIRKWSPALAALAALAVAVRFEGAFLVAVVAVMLFADRRWLDAVLTALAGVTPILVYAAVSVSQGWNPLPTSVLVKGQGAGFVGLLIAQLGSAAPVGSPATSVGQYLVNSAYLWLTLAAVGFLFVSTRRAATLNRDPLRIFATIVISVTVLHLLFARTHWFFRYDAYLVALLGLSGIGLVYRMRSNPVRKPVRWSRSRMAFGLVVCLACAPVAVRAVIAFRQTPVATRNIYEQQIQIAEFIKSNYNEKAVAVNDIGAISFYTDAEVVDLYGLGDRDIAARRIANSLEPEAIGEIATRKEAQIAVVYSSWYDRFGGIPKEWILLGQWRIKDNVVCGSDVVDFYAVNSDYAPALVAALNEYRPSLPPTVEVLVAEPSAVQ